MKIGLFSDRYLPQTDGIAYSIETFRTELEKLGHEVYIFAPKPSLNYKETSSRIIRFAAIKGLFFEDYLLSLFFPPQALAQIKKLNLDIVHFHTPSQIGLLGAYFALHNNVPLVTTYHTDLYEYIKHYPAVLPGNIVLSLIAPVITGGSMKYYRDIIGAIKPNRDVNKWNQAILVQGLTLLHNRCDLIITPSQKIEKQLHSWKTKSRIVTLPTGVDKITSTSREELAFAKRYNLTPEDQVILFVGRIGTEKNLGVLIEAFDIIGAKNANAKLMFVGYGDDLPLFQDQAESSKFPDRIIFTGRIERRNLGAAYHSATVFAFPSLADTQGMVVNEAACAGLPIVIVDHQITEVVQDGKNGLYARNNARDLATKLLKILDSPSLQRSMSKISLKLANDTSASKQAAKASQIYQETIQRYNEAHSQN